MTILEKIKFEEDWLSEVNLTKENIKIAFDGIRATVLEQQSCDDCVSRKYIEPIVEELENICINGDEHILSLLSNIKNAPSVTPKGVTVTDFADRCRECGKDIKQIYISKILDKVRAELIQSIQNGTLKIESGNEELFRIIDKYKESEG